MKWTFKKFAAAWVAVVAAGSLGGIIHQYSKNIDPLDDLEAAVDKLKIDHAKAAAESAALQARMEALGAIPLSALALRDAFVVQFGMLSFQQNVEDLPELAQTTQEAQDRADALQKDPSARQDEITKAQEHAQAACAAAINYYTPLKAFAELVPKNQKVTLTPELNRLSNFSESTVKPCNAKYPSPAKE